MRTEAAAREGRGFFFCFGACAIEALIQFNGKSVEALDPPSLHSSVGRQGNCALLQETSPSADEKLIGKC
jgi:hypothetical protein